MGEEKGEPFDLNTFVSVRDSYEDYEDRAVHFFDGLPLAYNRFYNTPDKKKKIKEARKKLKETIAKEAALVEYSK